MDAQEELILVDLTENTSVRQVSISSGPCGGTVFSNVITVEVFEQVAAGKSPKINLFVTMLLLLPFPRWQQLVAVPTFHISGSRHCLGRGGPTSPMPMLWFISQHH